MEKFLMLFPFSRNLESKWWHRLAKIAILPWQILFTTFSALTILLLIVLIIGTILLPKRTSYLIKSPYGSEKVVKRGEIAKKAKIMFPTYSNIDDSDLENKIILKLGENNQIQDNVYQPKTAIPTDPNNINKVSAQNLLDKLWSQLDENYFSQKYAENFLLTNIWNILIAIPILLLISLLPTIFYRVLLYVAFGKDLKTKV